MKRKWKRMVNLIKLSKGLIGKLKPGRGYLDNPSKQCRGALFKDIIKEVYDKEGGKVELATLEVNISYKYVKVEK